MLNPEDFALLICADAQLNSQRKTNYLLTTIIDTAPTICKTDLMPKRRPKMLSDQLREAIRNAGCSCYRISRETGVDAGVLSKFLSGERGVSLGSADLLCEFLDLEITKRRRRKKKG